MSKTILLIVFKLFTAGRNINIRNTRFFKMDNKLMLMKNANIKLNALTLTQSNSANETANEHSDKNPLLIIVEHHNNI